MGSKNATAYFNGYNCYPTTASDVVTMQYKTDATQIINVSGNPNGVVAGNVGSIAMDRTNGNIYRKISGTGTTTWQALSTQDLHWPKFIVGDTANGANYATIAAAYAAASAGDVIAIQANQTLTEDLTVDKIIYITGLGSSGQNGYHRASSTLKGKFTINSRLIASNLTFETNGDVSFAMNAASSLVICDDCCFNSTNANTVLGYTSNSNFICRNCTGGFASTYTLGSLDTTVGQLYNCNFGGTGTLAATDTKTSFYARNCAFGMPFTTTNAGGLQFLECNFGTIFTPYTNQTWVTTSGTQGAVIHNCQIYSGTASCISVGAGTIVDVYGSQLNSSNTNVITGAGTINYSGLSFTGSSVKINTTTQVGGLLQGGVTQAPSAGFIGQQIRATVANPGNAIANATATNLTSISLTAGIWDVSLVMGFAGATTVTQTVANINTSSATLGTLGDNRVDLPGFSQSTANLILTIPSYRITLTSTTTVYAVGYMAYTAGTGTFYGRISATRVG